MKMLSVSLALLFCSQCMCCYKDFKNFERFNNLVQLVLHRAIGFIESLPRNRRRALAMQISADRSQTTVRVDDDAEDVDVTGVDPAEVTTTLISGENTVVASEIDHLPLPVARLSDDASASPPHQEEQPAFTARDLICDSDRDSENWSIEEKDRLFQFVAKVFLTNFPLYIALKHCIHTSLEDLSKHDASALNNYCELSVSQFSFLFC
jgi:ubiquitin carboxyl-terminal hydrolase 34